MTAIQVPAITVRGLRKSYGAIEAVRGIDLDVAEGEVFGLLGPNGAGKTTTVEILEGYRPRSAGEVSVLGHDPAKGERDLKERIGIVLQETGVERYLNVTEVLDLYRGYYRKSRPIDELLALTGLEAQRNQRVKTLSGGQKRRLDLALALAGDPELLFLDEPTTGFDPTARRGAWDVIKGLRELGTTIFLTTHYMDEAQVLADRVAVIVGGADRGRGTARQPGRQRAGQRDPLHPAPGPRRRRPPRPAAGGERCGRGRRRPGHRRRPHPGRSTPSPAGPWAGASPCPTSPSPVPGWRTSTSSSPRRRPRPTGR